MLPQPFIPLGSAWVCRPPRGSLQRWVCRLMLPNGLGWAWGASLGGQHWDVQTWDLCC